jgi:hypothetical protein
MGWFGLRKRRKGDSTASTTPSEWSKNLGNLSPDAQERLLKSRKDDSGMKITGLENLENLSPDVLELLSKAFRGDPDVKMVVTTDCYYCGREVSAEHVPPKVCPHCGKNPMPFD